MASAVLVTFSAEDVARFGEARFAMLREAITPALNVWAGENVFWAELTGGGYHVLGRERPKSAAVEFAERYGIEPGRVSEHPCGGFVVMD